MRVRLDATDWRILKELQADGRLTNVALAQRVGLSPPPCLRRVQALERAGFIRGYHAVLDEALVGFEVTAFALVTLRAQGEAELREFENLLLTWPTVREAHMLAGGNIEGAYHEEVQRLMRFDPLTNIFNKRHFESQVGCHESGSVAPGASSQNNNLSVHGDLERKHCQWLFVGGYSLQMLGGVPRINAFYRGNFTGRWQIIDNCI